MGVGAGVGAGDGVAGSGVGGDVGVGTGDVDTAGVELGVDVAGAASGPKDQFGAGALVQAAASTADAAIGRARTTQWRRVRI
jgi:hypothetical protein